MGSMAVCEVCGNDYDKTFEVRRGDETHVFDSFECAIHALAPTCDHCGCRIIGHGIESDGHVLLRALRVGVRRRGRRRSRVTRCFSRPSLAVRFAAWPCITIGSKRNDSASSAFSSSTETSPGR
jgi:hypothetical protein